MSNIAAVDAPSLKSLQRQAKDHFAVGRLAEAVHFFRQGLVFSYHATGRYQGAAALHKATWRHGSGCWGTLPDPGQPLQAGGGAPGPGW